MDMMILGETLIGKSAEVFYSYWMPSGGNDAIGAIDVIFMSAASAFDIKMETKNSEQADSAASVVGSQTISSTTPGVTKVSVTGAKELVRYVIAAKDGSDQSLHFQLLQPQWVPN